VLLAVVALVKLLAVHHGPPHAAASDAAKKMRAAIRQAHPSVPVVPIASVAGDGDDVFDKIAPPPSPAAETADKPPKRSETVPAMTPVLTPRPPKVPAGFLAKVFGGLWANTPLFGKKPTLKTADVASLLNERGPDLDKIPDTIDDGKYKLALHYSIDTSLQSFGKELLRRYHPRCAAIVTLEPASGRVLMLVSYTNPDDSALAPSEWWRSVFPAASVVKVVTAAGAIERAGLCAESLLRTAGSNHTLYKSQLVKDLPYFREVSLAEAFALSMNPVFARIGLYNLGPDGFKLYSDRFGFNESLPFELRVSVSQTFSADSPYALAELTSGFNQETQISPVFGALIASAVSYSGCMPVPTLVDSIVDLETGNRVYQAQAKLWRTPVHPATADELVKLMQTCVRSGTARKSFGYVRNSAAFDDFDYGGKTGNIDKKGYGRIDWFIGFARRHSDRTQHIALGIVTVHGPFWTVHSSLLGAEIMRRYVHNLQAGRRFATQPVGADSIATAVGERDPRSGS
jgi:penicillin-binding protein A